MSVIIPVLVAAFLGLGVCCFHVSAWHSHESRYWTLVAAVVRADPRLDAEYRPILEWAQAHRPGIWERLCDWQPPDRRMTWEVTR